MERIHDMKQLTLIALLVLSQAIALAGDWELARDKDDIKVYTRDVDGSKFKAFKGETQVSAELNRLLALMDDTAACVDWMHTCKSPRLIRKLNPLERYTYMVNDLPWPVSDRALLLHATISQSMDDRVVTVALESLSPAALAPADQAQVPDEKGVVLIEVASGFFRFTPLEDNTTHVEYRMHTEPSGSLPASLVNSMLVDTPFYTLKNMKVLVTHERYRDFRPF